MGPAAACRTAKLLERSEAQTPARTEIWIEISVPPPLRLLDYKSVDTRASPMPGAYLSLQ